jgi:hypothetical protein
MNQGDRLAFSNGIIILSVLAALLLVVFGGDTHALIPLSSRARCCSSRTSS